MNNFLYLYKLKKSKKVILGKNVKIGQKNIFEGFNKIDSFSRIFNCYLGKYSYIGESCDFREIKHNRKIIRLKMLVKRLQRIGRIQIFI